MYLKFKFSTRNYNITGKRARWLVSADISLPYHALPFERKTLSTLVTIIVAGQSPFSATVAEFGDYSRHCGQGLSELLAADGAD